MSCPINIFTHFCHLSSLMVLKNQLSKMALWRSHGSLTCFKQSICSSALWDFCVYRLSPCVFLIKQTKIGWSEEAWGRVNKITDFYTFKVWYDLNIRRTFLNKQHNKDHVLLLTTRWSSCSALDSVYWGSRFNLQFTLQQWWCYWHYDWFSGPWKRSRWTSPLIKKEKLRSELQWPQTQTFMDLNLSYLYYFIQLYL